MKIQTYAFILTVFFLTLRVHSSILLSSEPQTKQVIVHSCNAGDGWGDPSSALFIAMRFKKLGFRVYVVNKRNLGMENEISDYFKIFGPSLQNLYGLSRGDIYFYTEKLACDFETAWKDRLFSTEQLLRFLPSPSENPGLVIAPYSGCSAEFDLHYSNCSSVGFSELGYNAFSCNQDSRLKIYGIYIYDKQQLQEIANNVDQNDPFISLIEKQKSKFYFTYFGAQDVENKASDLEVISICSRQLEFLNFVVFLEEKSNDSILVAFKNPGPSVLRRLFNNPFEFIDQRTGKLRESNKIWKLKELWNRLNPEYSHLFCNRNSEKISVIFYNFLPNNVFLWAIQRSEDFVGCTGDDSFSRVISMGKIPLYHALGHKIKLKDSFVDFMDKQQLPQLTRIFSNFIYMKNARYKESFFMNIINTIDRIELLKEMQEFKSKTIEIIKKDYSLFDHVLKELYGEKPNLDSLVEKQITVFDDAQVTLAFRYWNDYGESSLAEIFTLYFSAILYQQHDYVQELEQSGLNPLLKIYAHYSDPQPFETFINYLLKVKTQRLTSTSITQLVNEQNLAFYNAQFTSKLNDPEKDSKELIKKSHENFLKHSKTFSQLILNLPDGQERCKFFSLLLRCINSPKLENIQALNCFLENPIDAKSVDRLWENAFKTFPKNCDGFSEMFLTFEQFCEFINLLVPEEKFKINATELQTNCFPNSKEDFDLLGKLQNIDNRYEMRQMIEKKLQIFSNEIRFDESMNTFLREIAFNENQQVFRYAIEAEIKGKWNEIQKSKRLQFEKIISILNSIKGKFDKNPKGDEEIKKYAGNVIAKFSNQVESNDQWVEESEGQLIEEMEKQSLDQLDDEFKQKSKPGFKQESRAFSFKNLSNWTNFPNFIKKT